MKQFIRILFIPLILILLSLTVSSPAQAQTPFPNCRLGVGGDGAPNLSGYNINQLNIGIYLDWLHNANPQANLNLPPGVKYFQVVHVKQAKVNCGTAHCIGSYVSPAQYGFSPSAASITDIATNNPGMTWFIGNEIERIDFDNGDGTYGGQDEITPELYATAFHEIQEIIKTADPTAQVGIGSLIEATPLRLKYLDKVWDSYFNQFGYLMGQDIDVWNIHGFILREIKNSWGAEIPAGLTTDDYDKEEGWLYGVSSLSAIGAEHKNLETFKELTVALRTWMAEHGERNKPLINTEYGILYKSDFFGISQQDVNNYMTNSFDYLLSAKNSSIGYPADENRLVQGWIWYSLNAQDFNGNLFNPSTKALTTFGSNWKTYVTNPAKPLASQAQQNLLVANLRSTPEYYNDPPEGVGDFTLQADVSNSGNSSTNVDGSIEVKFYEDAAKTKQIGDPQIIDNGLAGCGETKTVEVVWEDVGSGAHPWYVEATPIGGEANTNDNIGNDTVFVFNPAPTANLGLTKTVDNASPYEIRDKVNYRITVTNPGPEVGNNIIVKDIVPNGLTYSSYKATQGSYFTSGPWLVGNLEVGESATLTITAKVQAGQAGLTIVNTATISSTDSVDTTLGDNSASVSIVPLKLLQVYLPLVVK